MAYARCEFVVQDARGNVVPGAEIRVRKEASGAPLATLYSDRAGTVPLANPFTVGTDGVAAFHAPGGAYRINATKGAFSAEWRYRAIGLAAEMDVLDEQLMLLGAVGLNMTWDSSTSDSNPGAGLMRANNADLSAATELYVSYTDRAGNDVEDLIALWDDSTSAVKGHLTLRAFLDATTFVVFGITGAITDATTYAKIPVSFVGPALTVPSPPAAPFDDDAYVDILYARTGNKGDQSVTAVNARKILNGDEGLAIDFRAREAAVEDYTETLRTDGRPEDLITLTRASDATYFDREGVLKSASSGVLRYHYDPATRERRSLLVEGSAINLFLQSRFAATWSATRATLTANDTTGKDGTTGAAKLTTDSTAANTHGLVQNVSITSGKSYCKSVLAKAGSGSGAGRYLCMQSDSFVNWSGTGNAFFDLISGTVVSGAGVLYSNGQYGMLDVGDGWYLCWIWMTASVTNATVLQAIFMASTAGASVFDGNGTDYIYLDEAQFEEGTSPSSRIRTTTATVTRAADSLAIGQSMFPVLGKGDCTLYWRGRVVSKRSTSWCALLDARDSGFNERIAMREGPSSGDIDIYVVDGGSTVADTSGASVTLGSTIAIAVSVKANDLKLYANGAQVDTDGALTVPTIDRLFVAPTDTSRWEIDELAYIARALSADELAALTTV